MQKLLGKSALITGGTSGIGLETAQRFVSEGARVIITGSSAKSVDAAKQQFGDQVLAVESDAGNLAAQNDLAALVATHFGKLDIVFLNAGIATLKPIESWGESEFDRLMDVNLKGPFFLMQRLLPSLASPASVIINGSINARIGMANSSVYAASKAAIISFARTLSGELIDRGIRVNAISPGPVETPLYGKLGMSDEELSATASAIAQQIPAGRFGRADEIAELVLLLASDASAYIVGSDFVVDGGMSNL